MLEALEYYQSLAQKFQGQILTGPGIVTVLAGLCIWLSGLRLKRILGAFAGAVIGAAGVLAVGRYPAGVVLTACAIGLAAGAIISEIVLGLLVAVIGTLAVMMILAGGLTDSANKPMVEFFDGSQNYNPDEITSDDFVSQSYPTWPNYEQKGVVIPVPAALEITNKMAAYFAGRARKVITAAGIGSYAGAGLAVIIIVVLTFAAKRLFVSITAATLGAGLIFAGMIILLFYKGSKPVSLIAQRPGFYWIVFMAMVVFGVFVQLFLLPSKPKTIEIEVKK
jgi:hypothetical protein